MKKELIIEKYGLGNAVLVLERKKIVDLFIDPPQILVFIPQILLLRQKYKGEYLKEEDIS